MVELVQWTNVPNVKLIVILKPTAYMININETKRHKTVIIDGDPYDTSRVVRRTVSFLGITIWKRYHYFSNQFLKTNLNDMTKRVGFIPKKDGKE
jgi:hypothetical protein